MSRLRAHLDVRAYFRLRDDILELGNDPAKIDDDLQALAKLYQYVHRFEGLSSRQRFALKASIRKRMKRCMAST